MDRKEMAAFREEQEGKNWKYEHTPIFFLKL